MILKHQHNKHTHSLYTLRYRTIHIVFFINPKLVLNRRNKHQKQPQSTHSYNYLNIRHIMSLRL